MGGIRKVSHTHQRQDFRSRLQRALSLSSSESEKASSPSTSESGDTTGDEALQDANDSDDQENSHSADESEKAPRERRTKTQYPHEYVQSTRNDTVRNDLADIFARLAIVETEMKEVAKRGNNKATEGQKTGRSLRRDNSD
ncbi:hypothetical protein PENNAL_c0147G10666 [Penicillium nalgiovense]|uniref:Uncharacterized protein n=1 Tax=Penicillium nalgiovense TaxID=60175 RepID=A0A1V6X0S3_PENNA|nr:hypothetical protein PENNAL_c0147G10666 [Penicillium nalgiovense]